MFDTKKMKKDPVAYLTGKQYNYNLVPPAMNSRPLLKNGEAVLNFEGRPMMSPYASPIPSQSSSPLYDLFQPGPAVDSYEFPSGVSFDIKVDTKAHALNLTMAVGQTNVRVLPWGPNATTFMQLDDGADLWLTGPLSGCNIYATGFGKNIWVIHSNSNQNADNISDNNNVKRTTALNVASSLGGTKPLWGHLERGDKFYGGLGFVFGVRKGNNWFNYYYDGLGVVTALV